MYTKRSRTHNPPKKEAKDAGFKLPLKSMEGWILFVTNLHEETSEDDVKEAFSEYGDVKNINLNLDRRTGFVKGYALVEYEEYESALNAKYNLHNADLLGMTIKVDWCFKAEKINATHL